MKKTTMVVKDVIDENNNPAIDFLFPDEDNSSDLCMNIFENILEETSENINGIEAYFADKEVEVGNQEFFIELSEIDGFIDMKWGGKQDESSVKKTLAYHSFQFILGKLNEVFDTIENSSVDNRVLH
jgi:hypothetical protein